MSDEERRTFMAESNEFLQQTLDRGEPGIFASYGLIGAILFLGGAGYLLDWWLGTGPWLLLTGLLVGVTAGFYGLVRSARRPTR